MKKRTSLAEEHSTSESSSEEQPSSGFKSVNGSGEKGGVYGSTSGYVGGGDDDEVGEDEWDSD